MACPLSDNVYTHTFTPREYQVELLDSVKKKNTIICSSTSTAKAFLVVKLLQEYSPQIRNAMEKRSLVLLDTQNVQIMTSHISLLTDLSVCSLEGEIDPNESVVDIKGKSIIVTTAAVCCDLIQLKYLDLAHFNLLVIDDCLYGDRQCYLEQLMNVYKQLQSDKPRILGLVAGILGPELQPIRLEAEFQRLEKLLNSSVDTSSELVTLLRLCCRPKEKIVECAELVPVPLQERLKLVVDDAKDFLADHRFDLSEIYDGEFLEELRDIPDPREAPLKLLEDFLHVLNDIGVWGADQAALSILSHVEKLKVKTPYERHYLLLCVVTTVMITIRAVCDDEFQNCDEKERITQYSAPKVLRFLEVIRAIQPPMEKPAENKQNGAEPSSPEKVARAKGSRGPRRLFTQRPHSDDSLCALVFVHNRCTAKVLHSLLYVSKTFTPIFYL